VSCTAYVKTGGILEVTSASVVSFELNDLAVDVFDYDDMPQLAADLREQLIGSGVAPQLLFFTPA
jgi:hypothetical protein